MFYLLQYVCLLQYEKYDVIRSTMLSGYNSNDKCLLLDFIFIDLKQLVAPSIAADRKMKMYAIQCRVITQNRVAFYRDFNKVFTIF